MHILGDYEVASGKRSKREVFSFLQEKVDARLRGWQGKLMSQARKELMVKAVTSAIPMFLMNCFKLPYGIIDILNNYMAMFYWGNAEDEKELGRLLDGVIFLREERFLLRERDGELGMAGASTCGRSHGYQGAQISI
ncbi:hypothetical protein LIER_42841 [Lithospermum erythrorhizon]|uniref:Uncharacterized protein n=1 Tax=Lithospermum erythrorhizon TaxID=34254 RepID=A0AAV3P0F2_LITER